MHFMIKKQQQLLSDDPHSLCGLVEVLVVCIEQCVGTHFPVPAPCHVTLPPEENRRKQIQTNTLQGKTDTLPREKKKKKPDIDQVFSNVEIIHFIFVSAVQVNEEDIFNHLPFITEACNLCE